MTWKKWVVRGGVALVVLVAAYIFYVMNVVNPRVQNELLTNPDGERAGIVMLLGLPDGRTLPVNYLREGNVVFVGADGPWWRLFRSGDVPVRLVIRGKQTKGRGRVVLDDPDYTRRVFARLRPTAPEWLPEWLNGKLVVIDIENAEND